jgi:hypothetical protein
MNMYKEHEFDSNDHCIHCCCSKTSIIIHKWVCNPIESPEISGKRTETNWDYSLLVGFLREVPAIKHDILTSAYIDDNWYVSFTIDINHVHAWNVVQIIGSIINTMHNCGAFKPISPSVRLNGGPHSHLSWIIESISTDFTPEMCYYSLHNEMPQPVSDLLQWDWDE